MGWVSCPDCFGRGVQVRTYFDGSMDPYDCPHCYGSGIAQKRDSKGRFTK